MKKYNEIQSRRDFFKKSVKSILPFIAVAAMITNPVIAKAAETAMGCSSYTCSGSCSGSCSHTCMSTCSGTCDGSCKITCSTTCSGTCSGSCKTTCRYANK